MSTILSQDSTSFRWPRNDALLSIVLRIVALTAAGIVILILVFLALESAPLVKKIGAIRFFTDRSWHPGSGQYSLVPMFVASALLTLGSIAIATPIGVISAVFCNYYAPRPIAAFYRRMLDIAGGMPSVIYGYWGLVVLVPLIAQISGPGTSLIAGILVLAIMILPTILLVTDACVANIPEHYLHGAAALGVTRSAIIWKLVVPAIKPGILTAVLLGATRAIGETMVVLMVCGNIVQIPQGVFDPVRALTSNIALEMAYALGDHRASLFVSGLLLLLLVFCLVVVHERMSNGYR